MAKVRRGKEREGEGGRKERRGEREGGVVAVLVN
jgi:hypothetical protein